MLKRRRILITGASSGLGAGMAREFARRGHDLALCARRTERLEALRDEILGAHPKVRVCIRALDVTDYEQVFYVFRALRDELGQIDRVVINAGVGKGRAIGCGGFHANRQIAETNFVAGLAQCEAALELFRKQDAGHLVTIASIAALRGMRGRTTTYGASKAGLVALSEGIRAEVIGTAIRVTTVYPGYIATEMTESLRSKPFIVDLATGARALVRAIEREPGRAFVPFWPWWFVGLLMRSLPLRLIARFL
jgi:short-subunit dehydrogenase